jgi:hypothetical protein
MSNMDENCKEVLDKFNEIKNKFELNSKNWRKKQNISVNLLFEKSYNSLRIELMNLFDELIKKSENISIILRHGLDFKCWNLLIERINLILKSPIDAKNFGKNPQVKIQSIYSNLLDDLKTLFEFYRLSYNSIYKLEVTREQEKIFNEDSPKYISNVLNFMGDIKKLKLILNKKFYDFKDLINLEGDNKKDSEDAIKFFKYSLSNNLYNFNVYNNLASIYKEFLEDHMNSIYWYIRGITYIFQKNENINKNKELLEKEFEIIRKIENKKKYIIQENVDDITYMKFDLEYFPILFCDIIGILFKKIDVDKLENHNDNLKILLTRILKNYLSIPDAYKLNYEIYSDWSKMLLLSIFGFHYTLDNLYINDNNENNNNKLLSPYSNQSDKIELNPEYNYLLNFRLYSHNITSKMKDNIKLNLKEALKLITQFSKCVIMNMNETNYNLVEKYLLIFFYWLSINYDMYNLIIDDEEKSYLKYLNYYLRTHNDINKFLSPQAKVTLDLLIDKINNYILPIETEILCFSPIYRFFELNQKSSGIYHIQEHKEIPIMNKLILIHFLDLFGLYQQNDTNINNKFHINTINNKTSQINVNSINDTNSIKENVDLIKKQLIINENKISKEKKEKPLIVLDASNIAMRHGEQKGIYSTKGIQIAIEFFTKNGHKVISFLPDYLFKEKDPNKHGKKRVLPDNLSYLYGLVNKGLVVKSPPQDYDDSYCIQYAKTHDAFIVSNDMFRDYIDNIKEKVERETERNWRDVKCISYTFNGDEFLPNPDAPFFKQFGFNLQEYNKNISN